MIISLYIYQGLDTEQSSQANYSIYNSILVYDCITK